MAESFRRTGDRYAVALMRGHIIELRTMTRHAQTLVAETRALIDDESVWLPLYIPVAAARPRDGR
jgi:hypothetical protein